MKILPVLILLQALLLADSPAHAQGEPSRVAPVLEFPEPGLDDSTAYEGYRTRFIRDARSNVVQTYLNQRHGRVVNLLVNGANESASFTVRDTLGQPALLRWNADALVDTSGGQSAIEYILIAEPVAVEIGHFLLGSMRLERDFQYQEGHLQRYDAPPFQQPELIELIGHLDHLPSGERDRQLSLLNARSTAELRSRLQPAVTITQQDTSWFVLVKHPSFDGRNQLTLEVRVDWREADAVGLPGRVAIRSRSARPLRLTVRVTTDSPALTPLYRDQIFSDEFRGFYERARQEHDRILSLPAERLTSTDRDRLLRFRRLERQIRSLELMSYEEKLMAGLPNYATYFGRDMLMSALMMQPIWNGAMAEHVIASVLRKLTPRGEVSHEEALGGQAIRENAAAYNAHLTEYFRLRDGGQTDQADTALARGRALLVNLQAVRENYVMVDDDFQFPVLVARYLADPRVSPGRKRTFMLEPARAEAPESRLALVLCNLAYVARTSEPYARDPIATNLVSFPPRNGDRWFPGSWRDSNAGYAGGRFAMDINVIWVPAALQSLGQIVGELRDLGLGDQMAEIAAAGRCGTRLNAYMNDVQALSAATQSWRNTAGHFWVRLTPEQTQERVQARLSSLPEVERRYWEGVMTARELNQAGIEFLALSLDANGQPIPVVHTDPATHLFLEGLRTTAGQELRDIGPLLLPYPIGVAVQGLGPLVANDAYATPQVWEDFQRDHYHSPRVVWGREVNLLLLGLTQQINAAVDAAGSPKEAQLARYVSRLHEALRQTLTAVEESGLKHNELWTYRIEEGKLLPVRYPVSTDIQLWNLTDLALQYALSQLPVQLRSAEIPFLY